jgi:hypothetical protein
MRQNLRMPHDHDTRADWYLVLEDLRIRDAWRCAYEGRSGPADAASVLMMALARDHEAAKRTARRRGVGAQSKTAGSVAVLG